MTLFIYKDNCCTQISHVDFAFLRVNKDIVYTIGDNVEKVVPSTDYDYFGLVEVNIDE